MREKPAPTKTQKVYKLMRLGEDGKLYPLFIDSAAPTELGKWYDADSPNLEGLRKLPSGVHLIDNVTGKAMSLEDFFNAHKDLFGNKKPKKFPSKEAIAWATDNGARFVYIEDTEGAQRRFNGENRKYWNLGINGSGSVRTFSMRPGWHAGSLPTMRQIGKGAKKDLRDDRFVWVEGEVSADNDYNAEVQNNPDKDMPDRIPEDGFYLKSTNGDAKKAQADKVGWYVAGSFKANRIISDSEARSVIDEWNAAHPDKKVEYDYERESGKVFNAETMSLEEKPGVKYSQRSHGSEEDKKYSSRKGGVPTIRIEDKQEYAKLAHTIATDKRTQKGEMGDAFTADNYYIYTDRGDGEFDVHVQLPIVGNEDTINLLSKELKDGTFRNAKDIVGRFETLWPIRTEDNYSDVAVEGGRRGDVQLGLWDSQIRQDERGRMGDMASKLSTDAPGEVSATEDPIRLSAEGSGVAEKSESANRTETLDADGVLSPDSPTNQKFQLRVGKGWQQQKVDINTALAREAYERRVRTGWYQSVEAMQDSMLGLETGLLAILEAEDGKNKGIVFSR